MKCYIIIQHFQAFCSFPAAVIDNLLHSILLKIKIASTKCFEKYKFCFYNLREKYSNYNLL